MKDMVKRTTNYFPPIEIGGVLLSESKILNVSDMKYQWDEMNIHVIDNLMGLRHREIATNNANNEKARAILRDILDENTYIRTFKFEVPDYSISHSKISDGGGDAEKDDKFEKLLNTFINDGYEKVEEGMLPFEDSDMPDIVEEDSPAWNTKWKMKCYCKIEYDEVESDVVGIKATVLKPKPEYAEKVKKNEKIMKYNIKQREKCIKWRKSNIKFYKKILEIINN
jgi:hypothetical protein